MISCSDVDGTIAMRVLSGSSSISSSLIIVSFKDVESYDFRRFLYDLLVRYADVIDVFFLHLSVVFSGTLDIKAFHIDPISFVSMYVCMYVCTYVCMYVCMHLYPYAFMYEAGGVAMPLSKRSQDAPDPLSKWSGRFNASFAAGTHRVSQHCQHLL